MMIFAHVVIALISLILATWTLMRPSSQSLRLSYTLTGLTLASGAYLIVFDGAAIFSTCLTGFAYTLGVGLLLGTARYRLNAHS